MAKLNQLLAVLQGRKSELNTTITGIYHTVQAKALFEGITKTYQPRDEHGETLPGEQQKLQQDANVLLSDLQSAFTSLFNVAGAIDKTNAEAAGDIYIDGNLILAAVPVTHLMWLEKQLLDLRTVVQRMPKLDSQYDWVQSDEGGWITPPRVTVRTKKVPRNHIKVEATDKHPAQVDVYHEDTIVGEWTTRLRSGALPHSRVRVIVERINRTLEGVKKAREQANTHEVVDFTAAPLLEHIFQ